MSHKIITIVIGLSTFLFSCQNESELKWEETMKVHDEVMLKMQETGEMQTKLNALIVRAKTDSTSVLFTKSDTLKAAYKKLELAEEEMMDWMASIQSPKSNDDQDSILNYLDTEQKAIILVGEHMDASVVEANNILKSLEK
jgi:hypothetical protein